MEKDIWIQQPQSVGSSVVALPPCRMAAPVTVAAEHKVPRTNDAASILLCRRRDLQCPDWGNIRRILLFQMIRDYRAAILAWIF